MQGIEDEEVPKDCISPSSDVFSYFMLAAPNERKKTNRFTLDALMSYTLVFLTLAMQGLMLFCVYNKVIVNNTNWYQGIVNTGEEWNMIQPAQPGCNDGQSLCTVENGTYTCAPPSLQLIKRWDELDTDEDGIWTRSEVVKSREALKCKYAVDPVEAFDVLVALLKEREEHIWLHPLVKSGKALPKIYFTYIMGDVAMCGYRNEDMCGNLLRRGVFDVPLKHGNIPRVGNTTKSAIDYCRGLLEPGGLCERVLPSTYSTWKIESVQECRSPSYHKFVFKDPGGVAKSLLEVDYKAREAYEKAKTPVFISYKITIVFIWMLLIISQLREVSKDASWAIHLPTVADDKETPRGQPIGRRNSVLHNNEIHTIGLRHRLFFGVVTFLRIGMLCVLLYVGLNFLGRQTDYIDLLLDGVALIFILEIEKVLYATVLRQDVRTSWEESESIAVEKVGHPWLTGRPDLLDFLWFVGVALAAVAFMMYYTSTVVDPLYSALQCACLSEGDSCREAHSFSASFWDEYWMTDVPSSIQGINALKLHAAPPPTPKHHVVRASVNLLRHLRSHHLR